MNTTRSKKTHSILMSLNQIFVPGITCVVKVSLYKIALIIYRISPEKVRCEFVDFFGKVVLLPFTRNVIRPISQPVRKTFSQTPASYSLPVAGSTQISFPGKYTLRLLSPAYRIGAARISGP